MTRLEQVSVDTARRLARVDRLVTSRNRADVDLIDGYAGFWSRQIRKRNGCVNYSRRSFVPELTSTPLSQVRPLYPQKRTFAASFDRLPLRPGRTQLRFGCTITGISASFASIRHRRRIGTHS
jgi:hypothetical protein